MPNLIDDGRSVVIFCSGVSRIRKLPDGVNVELELYLDQTAPDGTPEQVVVAKIIRPLATWSQSQGMAQRFLLNEGALVFERVQ